MANVKSFYNQVSNFTIDNNNHLNQQAIIYNHYTLRYTNGSVRFWFGSVRPCRQCARACPHERSERDETLHELQNVVGVMVSVVQRLHELQNVVGVMVSVIQPLGEHERGDQPWARRRLECSGRRMERTHAVCH